MPGGDQSTAEILHAIDLECLRFGKRLDTTVGVTAAFQLQPLPGHDRFNLRLMVGAQPHW